MIRRRGRPAATVELFVEDRRPEGFISHRSAPYARFRASPRATLGTGSTHTSNAHSTRRLPTLGKISGRHVKRARPVARNKTVTRASRRAGENDKQNR